MIYSWFWFVERICGHQLTSGPNHPYCSLTNKYINVAKLQKSAIIFTISILRHLAKKQCNIKLQNIPPGTSRDWLSCLITLQESRYRLTWRFGLLCYKASLPPKCLLMCPHVSMQMRNRQIHNCWANCQSEEDLTDSPTHICLQTVWSLPCRVWRVGAVVKGPYFLACFCQFTKYHIGML